MDQSEECELLLVLKPSILVYKSSCHVRTSVELACPVPTSYNQAEQVELSPKVTLQEELPWRYICSNMICGTICEQIR